MNVHLHGYQGENPLDVGGAVGRTHEDDNMAAVSPASEDPGSVLDCHSICGHSGSHLPI